MAGKSSSTGPIIVAVIGVLGTVTAALVANWDKWSGGRTAVQQSAEQASQNIAPAQPATDRVPADKGMDAAAPISIAGRWIDAAGYEYIFEQSGNEYTYTQFKNGDEVNRGYGILHGRSFEGYFSGDFGQGSCKGEVSAKMNETNSTCTIGANSFPLRVVRSVAEKS